MDDYGKYLDNRISDPELEAFYMRMINVSAEEEMDMEARVGSEEKNPNLKKPELKKGDMRKIDVNPDEEFLLEFYRNKKKKEEEGQTTLRMSARDGSSGFGHLQLEADSKKLNKDGKMKTTIKQKLKWENPVRPLTEDITSWTSEDGKFLENVNLNDLIVKSSLDDLAKPISALSAVDPTACKELLNILELCKNQHKQRETFPQILKSSENVSHEYPLWATLVTSESGEGQLINDIIEALMAETMKYNEDRNFDLKGLWDVPRFLEIKDGLEIPWASDIAVGISAAHDDSRMVEGVVDWNGRPPPSTRKISVLICLTEASEYEGGEFELITSEIKQLKLSIGDVVLWPSFLGRRIKPVTKGKLVMLQIFNNGDYFK